MAYTAITHPTYPVFGDTVYVGVLNGSTAMTDGYRVVLSAVPDASALELHKPLNLNSFIPDIAGDYLVKVYIESTVYYETKPRIELQSTFTKNIAVTNRLYFPIKALNHTINLELKPSYDGTTTTIASARLINSDKYDSIVMSFLSDGYAQLYLSQFVDRTIQGDNDFYVNFVAYTESLIKKFNAHIGTVDLHNRADTTNLVTNEEIGNVGAAFHGLNELKSKLLSHESSATYHDGSESQSNLSYIPDAVDLGSAYVLLSLLVERYATHLANDTIHPTADALNTITMNDSLKTFTCYFVDYVLNRSIEPAGRVLDYDVTLQNLGFLVGQSDDTVDVEITDAVGTPSQAIPSAFTPGYAPGSLLISDGTTWTVLEPGEEGQRLRYYGGTATWTDEFPTDQPDGYRNVGEDEYRFLQEGYLDNGFPAPDGYSYLPNSHFSWIEEAYEQNAWGVSDGGTGVTALDPGDIVFGGSGNAMSKVAVGPDGYVLTSNGSEPVWEEPSTGSGSGSGLYDEVITRTGDLTSTAYTTIGTSYVMDDSTEYYFKIAAVVGGSSYGAMGEWNLGVNVRTAIFDGYYASFMGQDSDAREYVMSMVTQADGNESGVSVGFELKAVLSDNEISWEACATEYTDTTFHVRLKIGIVPQAN